MRSWKGCWDESGHGSDLRRASPRSRLRMLPPRGLSQRCSSDGLFPDCEPNISENDSLSHLSDTCPTPRYLRSRLEELLPGRVVAVCPVRGTHRWLVAAQHAKVCTNLGFCKSSAASFRLGFATLLLVTTSGWPQRQSISRLALERRSRRYPEKRSTLEDLQIPLPPLAEQKRIAGILDAADALRAKRREALAQLDTLLKSTFLDMFGDPVTNPMGWDGPKACG